VKHALLRIGAVGLASGLTAVVLFAVGRVILIGDLGLTLPSFSQPSIPASASASPTVSPAVLSDIATPNPTATPSPEPSPTETAGPCDSITNPTARLTVPIVRSVSSFASRRK